jgi:hypothetical protein
MTPLLIACVLTVPAADLTFEKQKIGTTTYEACSIFDVNNDGELDIVSGEYWHAGPSFSKASKICDVEKVNDYYDDFADFRMDINGDGFLDIVTGAWFGKKITWRENPKGKPVEWKVHDVKTVGNIEKICFWDIDSDGSIDIVPNTPGNPQRILKVAPGPNPVFTSHQISPMKTDHGLGFGDINGDGRGDLIVNNGWFEAPENAWEDEWKFHAEFKLYKSASVPILTHDVNNDGLLDIIVGAGHDYGLAWWKQQIVGAKRVWIEQTIETKRSQFHDMALADLDNDGDLELVTGKRYYAHSGGDPGAEEPVGLYYYELNGGDFRRIEIDYGPSETASGTGIYLWIQDINGDGWKDILAAGKEGMYLFTNKGR